MLYCLLVAQLAAAAVGENLPLRSASDDSLGAAIAVSPAPQGSLFVLASDTAGEPVESSSAAESHEIQPAFSPLRSMTDVLAELAGTISPQAGRSTGIPLFRGSSPKRIAVTYDGVPLNHSAEREGPSLLSLGMLDPAAVGEVAFRGGSSSAEHAMVRSGGILTLGSALELRQDSTLAASPPIAARVGQQFSSADGGWSARLTMAGKSGGLRYRVGGLGRILGDLRAGSGDGRDSVQPHTGLRQSTIHALGAYALSSAAELRGGLLMSRRDRQEVVSDLDNLALSRPPATLDVFDPEQLTLAYVSAKVERFGRLRKGAATVWVNRQEQAATFRRPGWDRTLFDNDRISVIGARGGADVVVARSHLVRLAVEGRMEKVGARRKEVRDEGVTFYQRGRFPGGTNAQSAAVLIEDEWSIGARTVLTGGLRGTVDRRRSHYGPSAFGSTSIIGEIDRSFRGLSWHARVGHQVSGAGSVTVSVGSGFRAPSLDELASNAYWIAGRDVPNPEVGPERAMEYDVSYRLEKPDGSILDVSLYRTGYRNFISREWLGAGPDLAEATNDDLFRFSNRSAAEITGIELDGSRRIVSHEDVSVTLSGSLAAQHISARPDIRRFVPPALYRAAFRLRSGNFSVDPFLRGALRTSGTHWEGGRTGLPGTPGWTTINLRGAVGLGTRTILNVTVENLTDVRYREHGSYVEAPGLNLIVALSYSL